MEDIFMHLTDGAGPSNVTAALQVYANKNWRIIYKLRRKRTNVKVWRLVFHFEIWKDKRRVSTENRRWKDIFMLLTGRNWPQAAQNLLLQLIQPGIGNSPTSSAKSGRR